MRLNECLNESSPKDCRVTLVTWGASLGGIERILVDYLTYLKNDIDFTVYILRNFDNETNLFSGAAVDLRFGHKRNLVLYLKFLYYAVGHRDQVFHLFNAGPFTLLILRLAAVKKIIYHIHGTVYWQKRSDQITKKIVWYLALYKWRHASRLCFLANSEYSKSRFREQISPHVHIEVLYNPFDARRFTPVKKETLPGQGKKIVYVGRLVKGKNLLLWLEAAEYILQYFPQTRFTIIGEGNLKTELLRQIKARCLENYIQIIDCIDQVERIYQAHDLLLFLSERESFSNVVVESVLTQTPVIASDIPALKEIFKDYPEFLVKLDNHILAALIERLKQYDSLMEAVTRARQEFIRKFNLENHLRSLEKFYHGINIESMEVK